MSNEVERRAEVLQGTLDLMVLQTLNTLGPQHGYAIVSRLEQVSGGAIQLNMGSLYPGLIRPGAARLPQSREWGVSDSNRKARFYRITRAGKRLLAAGKKGWDRMVAIVAGLFGEAS
jgi:transcriptional regulator